MPAPASATYSVAALSAAHAAFRDLIDAGTGPGEIRLRDAADTLLATVMLDDPCGIINGSTGALDFAIPGGDLAAVTGTLYEGYAQFCDSAGVVHLTLPTETGTAAIPGKLVVNGFNLIAGAPLDVVLARVG